MRGCHSTGLAGNLLGDLHYTTEVRGLFFPCLMPQENKLHQGGAPRTHSGTRPPRFVIQGLAKPTCSVTTASAVAGNLAGDLERSQF